MTSEPSILFLADSHLRGPSDPNQQALIEFLQRLPPQPGGICILGDLFDYLAGSNLFAAATYHAVLEQLRRFAPFHYLEGNHDFDLSPKIPGLEAAIIHPQPASQRMQGIALRLLHGDRSHPKDWGTKVLRRFLQSGPLRLTRDHVFSDEWVFRVALSFANWSRKRTWPGRAYEYQSAREMALQELQTGNSQVVLYAHTHMPFLESLPFGVIANPGSAVVNGSYLELCDHILTLRRFPDREILPPGPVPIK